MDPALRRLVIPDTVVGAFAQGRMTGTFIFWSAAGARVAVMPFDNDAKSGTVALWYTPPDGRPEAGRAQG